MSFSHSPNEQPGPCGRGAGRQNVQTIFMTPQGQIYHVATGFLSPEDLRGEIRFASATFENLRSSRTQPKETLVSLQESRMRELGFSEREIYTESPFQQVATGFSPADLGIKMPSTQILGDVGRNRILRDTQFVLKHPLLGYEEFESDPTSLVGSGPTFFGSNASMNVLDGLDVQAFPAQAKNPGIVPSRLLGTPTRRMPTKR